MSEQDRVGTWDANQAVDAILGAEGGIAVWVGRNEGTARAAMRRSKDIVDTVMLLAALRIGVERLEESIAEAHGLAPHDLRGMILIAQNETTKVTEHATRIQRSKP